MKFQLGWFANPIFGRHGDYPKVMIDDIKENSLREGKPRSRLPFMSEELARYIKGSADFFGFNYYTSRLVEYNTKYDKLSTSWEKDSRLILSADPSWPQAQSPWLYSVPEGLRGILVWIKNTYNNPTVIITENGWSDPELYNDQSRINYLNAHLIKLSQAINIDKCNIIGHTVWSIIDNFEWLRGYS